METSYPQPARSEPVSHGTRSPVGLALLVAAATVICLAPFCGKAFHIDDTLFLWKAEQIARHPGDFYGFTVNWNDQILPIYKVTQNPPLAAYTIALAALLFGWSEAALHLVFLLPAVLVMVGTFLLARRFCKRPVTAALIGLVTPVFLLSAGTVMCDVMMLALWVWAVILWLRGLENGSSLCLLLAALLAAAAALTKYFGISLVPLLLAYSLFRKKGIGVYALFLLIPPAALLGFELLTRKLYGCGLVSNAAAYSSQARAEAGAGLAAASLSGFAFTGGCLIPFLFYAPLVLSRKALGAAAALAGAVLLLLPLFEPAGFSPTGTDTGVRWGFLVQFSLCFAVGVVAVFLALDDLRRFRDPSSLLLSLWVLGTFFFAVFLNWTMNGRSLLPLVPAAAILLVRRFELPGRETEGRPRLIAAWPPAAAWPLVPAALIGLLVATADYSFAGTARRAAAEITEKYGGLSGRIWFGGHWGFQYYMEKGGAIPVDVPRLKAKHLKRWKFLIDDVWVVPSNCGGSHDMTPTGMEPHETLRYEALPFLSTMSPAAGAGFYSARTGSLPFVFGPAPPEEYKIYVGRKAKSLLDNRGRQR